MIRYAAFVLLLGLVLAAAPGHGMPLHVAASRAVNVQAASDRTAAQPAARMCVALALDMSGSMQENDPSFWRFVAARLFIALLDDGDRVGVVVFSSAPRRLTPQLVTIGSPRDKLDLMNLLAPEAPNGWTDIQAALRDATAMLDTHGCQVKKILILTDGKAEMGAPLPAGYEMETVDLVRSSGAGLMGIALTAAGETVLLNNLAAASIPAGVVLPARTSNDLIDAFLAVGANLKDRTIIGAGQAAGASAVDFTIDAGLAQYVHRVTFVAGYAHGTSVRLLAPDGAEIAAGDPRLSFATVDSSYAVFTIDRPAAGTWRVEVEGASPALVRAIFHSRLHLQAIAPQAFHPLGQPITLSARVVEEQPDGSLLTIIGSSLVSARITRPDGAQEELDRLYDDGTHGDLLANDGIFSGQYARTDLPGEYRIEFAGNKDLIPLAQTARSLVVEFPSIALQSPVEPLFEFRGKPMLIVIRLVQGEPPALDSGAFVLKIVSPDGVNEELPMTFNGEVYAASYTPHIDGRHTLQFVPVDAFYKGVAYGLSPVREVEVRVVPAILAAIDWPDRLLLTPGQLGRGVELTLNVSSTSRQHETLRFAVSGAPGLAANLMPEQVPPGQSQVYLALSGSLPPGQYDLRLIPSAANGIDLPGGRLALPLEVFQPRLHIEPASMWLGDIAEEKLPGILQATFVVRPELLMEAALTVDLTGLQGAQVEVSPQSIKPGQEMVTVSVVVRLPELPPGDYRAGLRVLAGQEDLLVAPEELALAFKVTPQTFCSRWCVPIGGGFGLAMVSIGLVGAAAARRPRPAGVLQCVRAPAGQAVIRPKVISAKPGPFSSPHFRVGCRASDHLRLPLAPGEQVEIRAARKPVVEYTGRPPRKTSYVRTQVVVANLGRGLVKVNDLVILKGQESVPLRSGMHIVVSGYEFVFQG